MDVGKEMAPQVYQHPGARPTESEEPTVDDVRVHPETLQGDPFAYCASRRSDQDQERLAALEERYRHELLDDQERQELRDELLRLRRRLSARAEGVR